MEANSTNKPVKGMTSSVEEIGIEAVPSDKSHELLVGNRRNSTANIGRGQFFAKEGKVGETAADSKLRFDKCLEVSLNWSVSEGRPSPINSGRQRDSPMGGNDSRRKRNLENRKSMNVDVTHVASGNKI